MLCTVAEPKRKEEIIVSNNKDKSESVKEQATKAVELNKEYKVK
jgi:hypothetical protein